MDTGDMAAVLLAVVLLAGGLSGYLAYVRVGQSLLGGQASVGVDSHREGESVAAELSYWTPGQWRRRSQLM